jgi:FkbM family methyltransferase
MRDEPWLDVYLPEPGDVALDVGANHGEWTRELARRFCSVYAVEPNAALCDELRAVGRNVEVLNVGAWDVAGWQKFTLFALDVHTSALGVWDGSTASAPVGTTSLWCMPIDDMPIVGKIDFIKMDTEGAELYALRGAARTIREHRPHMVVEIHGKESGENVQVPLGEWGYTWTLVRHPYFHEGDGFWDKCYWLVCEPH